jgi:hypothetical protein
MIALRRYRLPAVVDVPWFEIGPMREGRGEWRRTCGAVVSVGRTSWTLRWQVDVEAVRAAVLHLLLSGLASRIGRRP